jgi:hypothetical protein
LLASSPTISQEDHDDDESEQSDSGSSTTSSSSSSSDVTESSDDTKKDSLDGDSEADDAAEDEPIMPIITQVMYENRNILNLGNNVWNSGRFIQFTILPENNLNCFFQNRAQYWRLANNNCNAAHDAMEKCSCCDFSYPPQLAGQQGNASAAKNSITDSLMTFLKNNLVDYQNPVMSSSNTNVNVNPSLPINGGAAPNRRAMYNNNNSNSNNAPYAYQQMMQQQPYQNNQNNGYYGNNGGYNGQMNNGGGYNGTALALLNLMNASRNVSTAGAAFQATLNNSTRYFNNNNMNTNNNGFGLYKQF